LRAPRKKGFFLEKTKNRKIETLTSAGFYTIKKSRQETPENPIEVKLSFHSIIEKKLEEDHYGLGHF